MTCPEGKVMGWDGPCPDWPHTHSVWTGAVESLKPVVVPPTKEAFVKWAVTAMPQFWTRMLREQERIERWLFPRRTHFHRRRPRRMGGK